MHLPHPDALTRLARTLCELDARIAADGPDRYTSMPQPDGMAFHATDGGGDHAVLLVLEAGVLIRAFDHESGHSPYARASQQPDPALVAGLPEALSHALDRTVGPLEGFERTFVAWWTGESWEQRGDASFPADLLAPDAELLTDWLLDLGHVLPAEAIAGLLAGELAAADAPLAEAPSDEPAPGEVPDGWRRGDPFTVTLSAAAPVSDIGVLKLVRERTGGAIGAIKRALADGGPLWTVELQRHAAGQVERVGHLGALMDALEPHGGGRLTLEHPEERPLPHAMFLAMLGPDALWLR